MNKLRMKRHESFSIREGWFEKALNAIKTSNKKSIFSKTEGIITLGIGANMVKSLRYWMVASKIINDKNSQLTEFGELLAKYDPYFEEDFSWWMIHGMLASNFEDAPVENIIFNHFNIKNFSKDNVVEFLNNYFKENDIDLSNFKMADADISVVLRTYIEEKGTNPEDNLNSPLGKLGLLKKNSRNQYNFVAPSYKKLDYLVVYYFMVNVLEKEMDSMNIDDLMEMENSPAKLFNLDKNLLSLYLNDMKINGLITINKTAGLNMIYIQNKNFGLSDIFAQYFERA